MLFIIQFPISDSRPFVDSASPRLDAPNWPNPEPNVDFVRLFGQVKRRLRGGHDAWHDELYYCSAHRAVKFPGLEKQSLGGAQAVLRPQGAFRRLFCDGAALARVVVGLDGEAAFPLIREQCTAAALSFMDLSCHVSQFNGAATIRTLGEQGTNLARLYLHATTRKKQLRRSPPDPRLVRAGRPLVIIEYEVDEIGELPAHTHIVNPAKVGGIPVSFIWLSHKGKDIGTWFVGHVPLDPGTEEVARRLRISLSRLHAEQEGLKQVFKQLASGAISFQPFTPSGNTLQKYVLNAMRNITQESWQGLSLAAVLEAIGAYEQVVSKDDRPILLQQLR